MFNLLMWTAIVVTTGVVADTSALPSLLTAERQGVKGLGEVISRKIDEAAKAISCIDVIPFVPLKNGVTVKKGAGAIPTVLFTAGMKTDADGSPHAYNPKDPSKGLDRLGNAHDVIKKKDGTEEVQGPNDPAPGYWISPTALRDKTITDPKNPARYVDSEVIPYISLPLQMLPPRDNNGVKLGDLAAVINPKDGIVHYAIVADAGPTKSIGEGSIALANEMGGGPYDGRRDPKGTFNYIVFKGSGNGQPLTVEEIKAQGAKLFKAWGEEPMAKACFP